MVNLRERLDPKVGVSLPVMIIIPIIREHKDGRVHRPAWIEANVVDWASAFCRRIISSCVV